MGKKKAAAVDTLPFEADAKAGADNPVLEQRQRMIDAITRIKAGGEYFRSALSGELRDRILGRLGDEIHELMDSLENVAKGELEKTQGHIKGLRNAIQVIRGQGDDGALAKAEAELAQFEADNALFLAPPSADGGATQPGEGIAPAMILETQILGDGKKDKARAEELRAVGFVYVDQTEHETETWRHDNPGEAARALVERLSATDFIVSMREA